MPAPPAPHASHDHSGGDHAAGVDARETLYAASIMVSTTLWLPLDHATAPQARSLEGLHREAEGAAETVTERPMLSPRGCRLIRDEGRIHALGRCHIGGIAYLVWALPPMWGELPKGT